jgi:hypothetical protein
MMTAGRQEVLCYCTTYCSYLHSLITQTMTTHIEEERRGKKAYKLELVS